MQEAKKTSAAAAEISKLLERALKTRDMVLVAIDGRCGSGKTTLGKELQEIWDANLFHMDDFYLRKEQRTKERYEEPGGNVDYERFEQEILIPVKNRENVIYRPYFPPEWKFLEETVISPRRVNLIEGTYSCQKRLEPYYDLKVFLNIDPGQQISRIRKRNGEEKAVEFEKKWIPLEELYFRTCRIEEQCDLCFAMGEENRKVGNQKS